MQDAIKQLVDGGIINEATRDSINEAWEEKLAESKEIVRAELREEFARRYDHDKSVMVESIDKMVTESLTKELSEFAKDKNALIAERVAHKRTMKEAAKKFESFVARQLAEEIKEFRTDRKMQTEATKKLEKFVIKQLAEEITEFSTDKKALVEAKVELVAHARGKINELQKKFVKKSARLVKEAISKGLSGELTQLKEDITAARENMFGRKIFEAFASEFTITHLNESKVIAKLRSEVGKRDKALAESRVKAARSNKLVESAQRETRVIKETYQRNKKIQSLVKTLKAEKASTMTSLLESTPTAQLGAAFEKYLPAVLNNGPIRSARNKATLTESRRISTGDKKSARPQPQQRADAEVIDIQVLAGLKSN